MSIEIMDLEDMDQEFYVHWCSVDIASQPLKTPPTPMNAVMYYTIMMEHFRNSPEEVVD